VQLLKRSSVAPGIAIRSRWCDLPRSRVRESPCLSASRGPSGEVTEESTPTLYTFTLCCASLTSGSAYEALEALARTIARLRWGALCISASALHVAGKDSRDIAADGASHHASGALARDRARATGEGLLRTIPRGGRPPLSREDSAVYGRERSRAKEVAKTLRAQAGFYRVTLDAEGWSPV